MFDFLFKKKEGELLPLPFSTDIHCHIIPGVDDGSPSAEQSLHLIEKMASWGLKEIYATPHFTDVTFENTPEIISPICADLQQRLRASGIGAELVDYSFEYRLGEGFIRLMEQGSLRPLKGDYILVENSFLQPLNNLDSLLFELRLKGLHPILAHPERYAYYHGNRKAYEQLHAADTCFQVNLLSLAGYYGRGVRDLVLWMLDKGMVDFIGTDLHHDYHVETIDRFLRSKEWAKLRPRIRVINDEM
jgi:tyrosine-protein phosphatase YwqE